MGSGTIQRKNYITKQGFFTDKDFDEIHGGIYWFHIEPLHGWENKRFFYVKPLEGSRDMYEITGEHYILTRKEQLTEHLKELREELEGVPIYYYFTDDTGRVIREESSPPITMNVKSKNLLCSNKV